MISIHRQIFALAAFIAFTGPVYSEPRKPVRMIYSYVTHDPKLPSDLRQKLMGLWQDEIAENTRMLDQVPKSELTGQASAFVMIGMSENVVATILMSAKTCENTGSTALEPLCAAKVIVDGKTFNGRACFVEAEFDPLPGETTSNTYSAFRIDLEKRTVTFAGVRKGKPVRRCHQVMKF